MAENQPPPSLSSTPTAPPTAPRLTFITAPRLNLLAMQSSRKSSTRTRLPSPVMLSDRLNSVDSEQVDTTRLQLISPPPEETLRRLSRPAPFTPSLLANPAAATKRKRTQPIVAPIQLPEENAEPAQPVEATPNPKPRKQVKHHTRTQSIDSPTRPSRASSTRSPEPTTPSKIKHVLFQSPHKANPDADFIPPIPAALVASSSRRATLSARARRSATPIPPYEPPKDVFTPPREVFVTPTISKSSKRKSVVSSKSSKATKLKVVTAPLSTVKKELPDVDLTAPMPPPSPTDDPLLLSFPAEPSSTPTRPTRMSAAVNTDVLPPSSPPSEILSPMTRTTTFDWTRHTEPEGSTDFSMMDMDSADADVVPLPLFNLDDLPEGSGAWSDSDDDDAAGKGADEMEGEGEYTGRWRMMKVRTKADPPSSATKSRMEEWGRPISPFPKVKKLELVSEMDEREGIDVQEEEMEVQEEEEVRRMSVEPEERLEDEVEDDEEAEEAEVSRMSIEPDGQEDQDEDYEELHLADRETLAQDSFAADTSPRHSALLDKQTDDLDDEQHSDEPDADNSVEDAFRAMGQPPTGMEEIDLDADEEEDEEEREVREMSVEFHTEEAEEEEPFDFDLPAPPQIDDTLAPTPTPVEDEGAAASSSAQQSIRHVSPAPHASNVAFPSFDLSVAQTPAQPRAIPRPDSYYSSAFVDEDSPMPETAVAEDSDDEDDSSDGDDLGVVKITSADPRAAARAAAILKQHDYDCFTKIMMKKRHSDAKKRRDSHSTLDDITKGSRRRNVASAGVGKTDGEKKRRRSTLGMGVIGDRVFIPGSPVVTLPELLKEAEAEVVTSSTGMKSPSAWSKTLGATGQRDLFKTPLPNRYQLRLGSSSLREETTNVDDDEADDMEERLWTKDDWKQLDACFTDERLEAGQRLGITDGDGLAPVNLVHVKDVVDRYIEAIGGTAILERCGEAWSWDNLLQRARALQNKQRSGNVAPPSTPYTPFPGDDSMGGARRMPSMDVPDFTPLGRRAPPPRKQRTVLPSPISHEAPFTHMPQEKSTRKLPASLLAPRYSHLLEEAVSISEETPSLATALSPTTISTEETDLSDSSFEASIAAATDIQCNIDSESEVSTQPATIGKRMKGLLFSYLPSLSKSTPAAHRKVNPPQQRGLPLPPPEVLGKARGPVATPIRPLPPKQKHPKELVHLHPAPPPPKISMIPRATKPQRLVELHPVPQAEPMTIPRPRRSSGGSVKDLVRSFEEMQGHEKSGSKFAKTIRGRDKPMWKP
ncbi:hypothetical protein BDQ12DRAFT_678161 [Crucibulum laeve]|uniref:Uncharacterized protein n=1 Tax=Crucibulum laeve TaxID=68775 RepID=A0A5C3M7W4_9AGAR|nr:hypothetical protein BDQ12DRAFT_678161 [Crucibulum laeve]